MAPSFHLPMIVCPKSAFLHIISSNKQKTKTKLVWKLIQTSPHSKRRDYLTPIRGHIHPVKRYTKTYGGPLPTEALISWPTTALQFRSCSSWQSSSTVASRYDPGDSLLSLCSSPWSRSPSNARWQMACTYKVRGWKDGQVDAVYGDRAISPLRHAQF